ncbi:MAG: hypothetical protein B7Z41_04120 [Rhizobiales bacterium 12-66-7]|nr:MAG: hypothetical protein B7Z41_04120 [Rhizobiales bacterium 12-66-7]
MASASAAQIGAIHVISKRIGLGEDERRALMVAATGKRSARDLTSGEAITVIDRLKVLQGDGAAPKGAPGLDGIYAPKLRALWLSGWHLGVVRDRTDRALLSFLERQTGLSHTRFLRDSADASRVIEALKAWLSREAGVEWPARGTVLDSKAAVFRAQQARLAALGCARHPDIANPTEETLDAAIRADGKRLRHALKGR